ncbi:MAG TPA: hypothetical protein VFD95_09580 [Usitatibacter sp.]|jgi:hypothetical protein|nr:hypothetical protein [Usitatibacter sp.]
MAHYRRILLAAAATCTVSLAQAPPADPCAAAHSREFDFWIGDWDVFVPDGKLAGTNRISAIYGCVLHEQWKTPKMEGQSFNRFDPDRGVWHQTWVDSTGGLLMIEGGLRDGAMVMSDATLPGRKDPAVVNEITWSRMPDGTVRQHWRLTKDGGKTWETSFDGKYVRSGRPQPR